jgi:hypothetical protein
MHATHLVLGFVHNPEGPHADLPFKAKVLDRNGVPWFWFTGIEVASSAACVLAWPVVCLPELQ